MNGELQNLIDGGRDMRRAARMYRRPGDDCDDCDDDDDGDDTDANEIAI